MSEVRLKYIGWFLSVSGIAHLLFYQAPSKYFPDGCYISPCGRGGPRQIEGKPVRPCAHCLSSIGLRFRMSRHHQTGTLSIDRPTFAEYRDEVWTWETS